MTVTPSSGENLPRIAVLVLAGGEGQRMGGDKPLRQLGGQSLLARAIVMARSHSNCIAISVHDNSWHDVAPEIARVPDASYPAGPIAALAAGLSWARDAGATFLQTLPCDTPFLPDDLTANLLRAVMSLKTSVALPRCGDRLQPSCGLWSVSLGPVLEKYVAGAESSLIGFAQAAGYAEVVWPCEPLDPFFNINTSADLLRAGHALAQR